MPSLKSQIVRFLLKRRMRRAGSVSLEQGREGMERLTQRHSVPFDVTVRAIEVAGRPAEWLQPRNEVSDAVILYLHGGGYVMGSCNTHRALAARISRSCGIPSLLLDYRLAPEHPYPSGLEDALGAWEWLRNVKKIHPSRIVLVGDSAGGGLALATCQRLRLRGEMPAALVCMSPWTDLQLSGESMVTRFGRDPFFPSLEGLKGCAALYAGNVDPALPELSPINADFTGFPPLLIQVGDLEVLLSDSQTLAARASAAGVDVQLDVWNGMWHVWQIMGDVIPEATRAIDEIGSFVRARLNVV